MRWWGWKGRTHTTVFERDDAKDERLHANQIIPTAWNQIEGSMASALGLPVLVLRQAVHNEGIFEASHHQHRFANSRWRRSAGG